MSELPSKIERLIEAEGTYSDRVFAVPGKHSIIDTVNPATGRSSINGHSLAEIREREPEAVILPYAEWQAQQIARQQTPIRWTRVTATQYHEMLEILPPVGWTSRGFLVGEPYDHCYQTGRPRFQAYLSHHGHYYASSRPLTVAEWRALPAGAVAEIGAADGAS